MLSYGYLEAGEPDKARKGSCAPRNSSANQLTMETGLNLVELNAEVKTPPPLSKSFAAKATSGSLRKQSHRRTPVILDLLHLQPQRAKNNARSISASLSSRPPRQEFLAKRFDELRFNHDGSPVTSRALISAIIKSGHRRFPR